MPKNKIASLFNYMKMNKNNCAILLIDEDDDTDAQGDMNDVHEAQSLVLLSAFEMKIKVCAITFTPGNLPVKRDWQSGSYKTSSEHLNIALNMNKPVMYSKNEPDAFTSEYLKTDLAKYEHIIIMGQSTNSCCANTAFGAINEKKVVTCQSVLRGASVDSKIKISIVPCPVISPLARTPGWPSETIFCMNL